MYKIIYYPTVRGEVPVKEFLKKLPQKFCRKTEELIKLLAEEGPNLPRPYADIVEGKIRELRVRLGKDKVRILYYFFLKDHIVLVHALRKKKWAIPRQDVETAERRMDEFAARYARGEVEL